MGQGEGVDQDEVITKGQTMEFAIMTNQEIDAEVARRIFDRRLCPIHLSLWCCGRGRKRYAYDITDAMSVVDEIMTIAFSFRLSVSHETEWAAAFTLSDGTTIEEEAETRSRAICHAALEVKLRMR